MAYQARIKVKGTKQGQFKGEGLQTSAGSNWIPVLAFSNEVQSPRDIATGQASGKRQWGAVKITKEWGAASPQALQACSTNEALTEIDIEFIKVKDDGTEYTYQTLTLTKATLAGVRRFTGNSTTGESSSRHKSADDTMELEEWSFTFQKIQLDDADGKTTMMDNWSDTQ
jgi:type VI secretion system secreted protein Hcp